jgi:hypothetical protein
MHTSNEFISIDDVICAIDAGKNMVEKLGLKKYKYEYKPIVYTPNTVMNSLIDFDYDEDELVHNLDSIEVIEETEGIYIMDSYQGEPVFISDENLPALYEIIRERLLGL